jgi:hypothetical protein
LDSSLLKAMPAEHLQQQQQQQQQIRSRISIVGAGDAPPSGKLTRLF